jgi:PAS domain S-box-containing protein
LGNDTSLDGANMLRLQHSMARVALERYKILVDSIEDYAIFLLDTGGKVVSWNKGAQKTKGYLPDEIIGKHFSEFYLEEDKKANKPERELELARKLGRVEDEDWRVRKDGSTFWANVVITALYDGKGKHIGFAKVTRDLTERKIHEDELRKYNRRLKRQQEEFEKLNASKDEFISMASHQLRTPSTAIKQLLGMLNEGFFGEVPENLLGVIKKAYASNERQIRTINNLLRVAQIDAGKVVLHKKAVDVKQMLIDIVDEQKDTVLSRGQYMVMDLPDSNDVMLKADHEHLRMAVGNLLDNASKYTPEGGTITVGLRQKNGSTEIYVSDTGVGIAQSDMRRLFDKFVRIQNDLSQKVEGSGLGLYWVQKVIELHGGEVEVESEFGKGTTFKITFEEETDA